MLKKKKSTRKITFAKKYKGFCDGISSGLMKFSGIAIEIPQNERITINENTV